MPAAAAAAMAALCEYADRGRFLDWLKEEEVKFERWQLECESAMASASGKPSPYFGLFESMAPLVVDSASSRATPIRGILHDIGYSACEEDVRDTVQRMMTQIDVR